MNELAALRELLRMVVAGGLWATLAMVVTGLGVVALLALAA